MTVLFGSAPGTDPRPSVLGRGGGGAGPLGSWAPVTMIQGVDDENVKGPPPPSPSIILVSFSDWLHGGPPH